MVSSSSSDRKESDDDCSRGVLGRDSSCEGSRQLGLFEVEMLTVRKGMTPVGKLDLLLHLVLGKEQA